MDNMGATSTTTTTPSPFDIEKADSARLMRNFMMPNINSGIKGIPGPLDEMNNSNILNQLRAKAGRYSISPGTNQFQQATQNLSEGTTMPDDAMTEFALQLYGGSQPASGESTKTETSNPFGDTIGLLKAFF